MCQMFHQSYSIILVLMIPTQKSINQHLSATPRHPIIHHQVITSMREIWSPRPPISMSSQSPATGTWAWASQGGGAKKKQIGCPIPRAIFFSSTPVSRGGARQGHHTSPGHHLYEGDLVSKTSNLNEFSISSNWGLGLGFSGGGAKKKNWLPTPASNCFFRPPPPLPGRSPAGPVAGD